MVLTALAAGCLSLQCLSLLQIRFETPIRPLYWNLSLMPHRPAEKLNFLNQNEVPAMSPLRFFARLPFNRTFVRGTNRPTDIVAG